MPTKLITWNSQQNYTVRDFLQEVAETTVNVVRELEEAMERTEALEIEVATLRSKVETNSDFLTRTGEPYKSVSVRDKLRTRSPYEPIGAKGLKR